VGKVASFAVGGLDLWFNSDDHLPPHLHAEKPGEWEVRVYFLRDRADMFETKWTTRAGKPSGGDLRELRQLVEDHRPNLLAEWEQKVTTKTPGAPR
jgi:hypothetical protein